MWAWLWNDTTARFALNNIHEEARKSFRDAHHLVGGCFMFIVWLRRLTRVLEGCIGGAKALLPHHSHNWSPKTLHNVCDSLAVVALIYFKQPPFAPQMIPQINCNRHPELFNPATNISQETQLSVRTDSSRNFYLKIQSMDFTEKYLCGKLEKFSQKLQLS